MRKCTVEGREGEFEVVRQGQKNTRIKNAAGEKELVETSKVTLVPEPEAPAGDAAAAAQSVADAAQAAADNVAEGQVQAAEAAQS